VPDDELDAAVDALAAEILRNSPGTNRRVKRLLADHADPARTAALLHERARPYGVPEDMQTRLSAR
jgi:enoyl-CoA hydratase/carnithine racemase